MKFASLLKRNYKHVLIAVLTVVFLSILMYESFKTRTQENIFGKKKKKGGGCDCTGAVNEAKTPLESTITNLNTNITKLTEDLSGCNTDLRKYKENNDSLTRSNNDKQRENTELSSDLDVSNKKNEELNQKLDTIKTSFLNATKTE